MSYEAIFKDMPEQEGDFGPCFAFSIHKSGSTMMHSMIRGVCTAADIPFFDMPGACFHHGVPVKQWREDAGLAPLFTRNLVYLGFRFFPEFLNAPEVATRQRKFALLVRDPRDALVSQYFSFGRKQGSHAAPKYKPEAFLEKLATTEDREIDEYVRSTARGLQRKLLAYREALDFDQGLVRRYEDVFFDKQTFLAEIFDHYGISVAPEVIARVAAKHDIRPEKEDDTKHIRKGTPGDHAEKLKPETIAFLNDTFREAGAIYGYDF